MAVDTSNQQFQSWFSRVFPGNRLFQVKSEQLTLEEDKNLPLQGTWTTSVIHFLGHFGGSSGVAGGCTYYRDLFKRVMLRGTIGGGTAGSVIGILPKGYRPGDTGVYPVVTNTGPGSVSVDVNGNVTHLTGGTTNVYLDGISFRAAG